MRFFFLFFLLAACSSQTTHWKVEQIDADEPITFLHHASENLTNGLDLEFIKSDDALTSYLIVHQFTIPKPTQKQVKVTLLFGKEKWEMDGYVRSGRQKVVLPEKLSEKILSLLLEEKSFTIQIPGYSTTVQPEKFSPLYEKMQLNRVNKHYGFKIPE